MKINNKLTKIVVILLIGMMILPSVSFAGNEDRAGQSGAGELLIMPFPKSSGWGSTNTACIKGLESMFLNVAGTAFTQRTEVAYANTQWLKGSDITINSFGLTQKVGEAGVIGLSVMSMGFGEIQITTNDLPEGGIGMFKPNFMNIGLSYARAFSNSIYGGIVVRIISESISDVKAQGVSIDAGIQYLTGENENIHFGIALRNIGTTMKFGGDGLSIQGIPSSSDFQITMQQRNATFELPALLNIGAAYDFLISDQHTITVAGSFTSNSFNKDIFALGLEYNFNDYLMLRGGYNYEKGMLDKTTRTTAYTGPSAGISLQVPLNKEKGSVASLDYSYRLSDPFQGTHCIGVRVNL